MIIFSLVTSCSLVFFYSKFCNDFKITSVSDITFNDENKPLDLNCYHDYRDLIKNEDLDILFVSLPNNHAANATLLGLEKNLHVFCEKPPARTLSELIPIKQHLAKTDLKLMYGFNHRFHLSVEEAKSIFDSKSYGKVINLNYITQVSTKPHLFVIYANYPKLVPLNYRKYLENNLRADFDLKGIPFRISFRKK